MRRRPLLTVIGAIATVALLVPASASAQSSGSVEPKIVGGDDTTISQYPWQAAVISSGDGSAYDRQFCGGSLLTSRIVITAAHCVYDTDPDCLNEGFGQAPCVGIDSGGDGTTKPEANDFEVVLGRTTLSDSSQGAEVAVSGVAYRANYNPDYQRRGVPQFDVGYLVLSSPSGQPQIKLPATTEAALWDPGSPVEISGWGETESGDFPDTLRAAAVFVVDDTDCLDAYRINAIRSEFDPATMVCAAAAGKDTCAGDSGGPLQAPLGGGVYRLVGITSWGNGCADPDFPGVYTRVAGDTMRVLVEGDVAGLESQFGLSPESPFGSAGTTRISNKARNPFAKCKRIRDKKKRKRCVKKVKKRLRIA